MSRKEPLPPRGSERAAERRARTTAIYDALLDAYPDAHCALTHAGPFELLVATILSAQCTDERVNTVTPELFRRWPDPAALAAADPLEVEGVVQPTGFFRQKARNIRATAAMLCDRHGGVVPHTIPELVQLPGVARKTANVVLANCYPEHVEGVAVDTHVQRIVRRLGLTRSWEPTEIERDLMRLLPRERWGHVTHLLIDHGRAVCRAPTPLCERCPIASLCPSSERFPLRRRRAALR